MIGKFNLQIMTKLDFRQILTDIRLIELSMIFAKKFPGLKSEDMIEQVRDPAYQVYIVQDEFELTVGGCILHELGSTFAELNQVAIKSDVPPEQFQSQLFDLIKSDYKTLIIHASSGEINMLKREGFTEIDQYHSQFFDLKRIMDVSDKPVIMVYNLPRFKVEMKITVCDGESALIE